MPQLRVAMVQVDAGVGDFDGNAAAVLARCREAHAAGAHLVVLPEMVIPGYPAEDLVLRSSFQLASRAAVADLARALRAEGMGGMAVVVGYLDATPGVPTAAGVPRGEPRNVAAWLWDGHVAAVYTKHHLPNYGVFDEYRYFLRGDEMPVVRLHGVDVATAICEDLWQEGGPVRAARAAGAGLLVVPNASPYEYAKDATREGLVAQRAAEAGCPIVYTNLVGGQDELVFDGGCFVVDGAGRVIARGERFTEGVVVVDLDLAAANDDAAGPVAVGTGPAGQPETMTVRRRTLTTAPLPAWDAAEPPLAPEVWDEPQVWAALVLGLRDYVRKNGFRTVVLGMSGGIDSAVVAALAADAIGGENVIGISMPSKYSSQHSRDDAADLAERIGARYLTVPIAPMFEAFMASQSLSGVAEENLQARIRGTTLMAWSNQHGSLVLAPGNKSELATGYSTIYGDAVGGFGPIKDVPKSLVFAIARWRNAEAERRGETPPIPPSSIEKPPSAELRPDQKDTDSLPDYAVLDQVIEDYIVHDRGYAELLLQGHPREVVEQVLALTDRAEWKRRQYPPGTKITPRAFGRDRRQPITNRWREPGV